MVGVYMVVSRAFGERVLVTGKREGGEAEDISVWDPSRGRVRQWLIMC